MADKEKLSGSDDLFDQELFSGLKKLKYSAIKKSDVPALTFGIGLAIADRIRRLAVRRGDRLSLKLIDPQIVEEANRVGLSDLYLADFGLLNQAHLWKDVTQVRQALAGYPDWQLYVEFCKENRYGYNGEIDKNVRTSHVTIPTYKFWHVEFLKKLDKLKVTGAVGVEEGLGYTTKPHAPEAKIGFRRDADQEDAAEVKIRKPRRQWF